MSFHICFSLLWFIHHNEIESVLFTAFQLTIVKIKATGQFMLNCYLVISFKFRNPNQATQPLDMEQVKKQNTIQAIQVIMHN
jgi:hypothetical protein